MKHYSAYLEFGRDKEAKMPGRYPTFKHGESTFLCSGDDLVSVKSQASKMVNKLNLHGKVNVFEYDQYTVSPKMVATRSTYSKNWD